MLQITPAGENALILYLGERSSTAVADRVAAATAIISAQLRDVLIDLIPSYASILVIYNPLRTDHLAVSTRLRRELAGLRPTDTLAGRLITLPAWYAMEAGPDLQALAERAGLGIDEVIDIHQSAEYRVYAIGFAPGFAYLGEVDARIAAPRLRTPRQKVPRGAIAIADRQTAVYPAPSPGGWNLIGRCPVRMFNPQSSPTMPLQVGDRVTFQAIERDEYLALGGEL